MKSYVPESINLDKSIEPILVFSEITEIYKKKNLTGITSRNNQQPFTWKAEASNKKKRGKSAIRLRTSILDISLSLGKAL